MQRVLSGVQPSGSLHLGNLVGALENYVKLQDEYQTFYMIADWHAYTSRFDDAASIDPAVHGGGGELPGGGAGSLSAPPSSPSPR